MIHCEITATEGGRIACPPVVHGTEDRNLRCEATAKRLPGLISDLTLVAIVRAYGEPASARSATS